MWKSICHPRVLRLRSLPNKRIEAREKRSEQPNKQASETSEQAIKQASQEASQAKAAVDRCNKSTKDHGCDMDFETVSPTTISKVVNLLRL